MKRGFLLAVLSVFIFVTFGGFAAPEKSYAGLEQKDLDRWLSYSNSSMATLNSGSWKTWKNDFDDIATTVFNTFKNSNDVGPVLAFSYVLNGVPKDKEGLIRNPRNPSYYYSGGMYGIVQDKTKLNIDWMSTLGLSVGNLGILGGVGYLAGGPAGAVATGVHVVTSLAENLVTGGPKMDQNLNSEQLTAKQAYESLGAMMQLEVLYSKNKNGDLSINDYNKQTADIQSAAQQKIDSIEKTKTDLISSASKCNLSSPLQCLIEAGAWFLTLGSDLLDWSITYGIGNFSNWVPAGITNLWKLVRDILYIFIFLMGFYLAFMYIIGRDEKFKKFIPWLIIFALFVNFSLPITKAMIDMSNIVALNIYNSTLSNSPTSTSGGTTLMSKLNIQTLVIKNANEVTGVPATILAIIFVFFAAWVFFQIAILLMVRIIVLTLCLIGSPLLLIDSMVTVTTFGEYVKKIRSIFFNQLFMADVFMIVLFITLQTMEVLRHLPIAGVGSLPGVAGDISLVFGIFMMLTLLYFMLKITKSMSGEVGSFATSTVNAGVGMFAGGVALRGGAMLGRATIGRGATALRDSSWVKNNQDTFLGRKAYDLTHSMANSSMDFRNSGIAQKFSSSTGMKLGAGGKIGYEAETKAKLANRMERGGRITTVNKDGTENQAGVEAKRRFYTNAGGLLTNRKDLQKELMEKAIDEATADDSKFDAKRAKTISTYSKLRGDDRSEFFNRQDSATQAALRAKEAEEVEIAHGEANEDNKKIKEKEAKEAQRIAEKAAETAAQAARENERTHGEAIEEDKNRTAQAAKEAREEADKLAERVAQNAKDAREAADKATRGSADAAHKQAILAATAASASAQQESADLLKRLLAQQSQNNGTTVNANNPGTSSVGTDTA